MTCWVSDASTLVGHDWGGPTAYAVAAAHPEAVRKLAILDVTISGDGTPDISQGGRRWHHAFHQTLDLPEALVPGREDIYLGWFYRTYGDSPDAVPDAVSRSICGCIDNLERCGPVFHIIGDSARISPTMLQWLHGSNCRCRCWRWVGPLLGAKTGS